MSTYKIGGTGNGALALTGTIPVGQHYRLISVTCNFSAAPTTSENFTVTLEAHAGAAYDTLLYSVNPSTLSTTDIVWLPDQDLILEGGDEVDVAFANTDARTWAAQITFKAV